ncbi:type II toxin-antitoxin system VapB family antitoxin [Endozoicomonas sp. 8E]|uniref:type II toxin-antitoxin system VapB family antitoxin n=1 Tax=Endozoicomonas sp. 8E TaxID=3035692 RepID=UPI0029394D4A|nr:type II toxin-antitoxin system VapB family antitoxin [Endozoicomonas sp. 8E]WOG27910.1 type II toxin-antitoxin system VapB family antitoxin [Endozoicomonas sp. 8E]
MKTTIFKNNRTQAVRIPKEFAFPDNVKHVQIQRQGNTLTISPLDVDWDEFFDNITACEDYPDREQPLPQERDFGDWT